MSRYQIYITPSGLREIKELPGNMRQRMKETIESFAENPRPANSKSLHLPTDLNVDVCRLRLDKWRVVYLISEAEKTVDILAIRKRPPYDYQDLVNLLSEMK